MCFSQENEVRKQIANLNIATDSVKYQSINNQNHPEQQQQQQAPSAAQKAYVLTEIENRPPLADHNLAHPPLQTDYPKSIQNNIESRVINRPTLHRQYSAPPSIPIPPSLPSIVHEPSNTVATIQNVPPTFVSSLNAQRYSSPVITSTYTNRETYSHANNNAREKVVVKVVKAPGWYLNDENERSSYLNAVTNGLLSENGLVYVNDVQKEIVQNAPINFTPSKVTPPTYSHTQTSRIESPSVAYSPTNIIPPALLQSQLAYSARNSAQPFAWPPCAAAYAHLIQSSPSHFRTFQRRSSDGGNNPYDGRSSYDVGLESVGRLAGDNSGRQYSLASLRLPSQLQRQLQSQPQPQPYRSQYSH